MAKLAFIGAGNMTSSMVGGLGWESEFGSIILADRNQDKLEVLQGRYKTTTSSGNIDAAETADVLVLAVKPQVLRLLCEEIAETIQQRLARGETPLILSVAAGVSAEAIDFWLGGGLPIVRSMPNIPSKVQLGMTGLFANDQVTTEHKRLVEVLCSAIGDFVWVDDEHQIHAVTAVSGSGPAYFFLFMEAMQKSAQSLGLTEADALKLVAQTAHGAAMMVKEGELSPAELCKSVMSPNGTTEQAIRSFEQDGLRTTVHQAMIACLKRSETMAEELSVKE